MNAPDLSTLPKRMRYAGEVLGEATDRRRLTSPSSSSSWSGADLRWYASEWQAADNEFAAREALAEEMAHDVARARGYKANWEDLAQIDRLECRAQAVHLVLSGWRKAESDA